MQFEQASSSPVRGWAESAPAAVETATPSATPTATATTPAAAPPPPVDPRLGRVGGGPSVAPADLVAAVRARSMTVTVLAEGAGSTR